MPHLQIAIPHLPVRGTHGHLRPVQGGVIVPQEAGGGGGDAGGGGVGGGGRGTDGNDNETGGVHQQRRPRSPRPHRQTAPHPHPRQRGMQHLLLRDPPSNRGDPSALRAPLPHAMSDGVAAAEPAVSDLPTPRPRLIGAIMSAIKSYLSLESIPQDESFSTPPKMHMATMQTNASLRFSQTLGSEGRSFARGRGFGRSNELLREEHPMEFEVREEEVEQNNSSITLQPHYTREDVAEILEVGRLVAFLGRECEQRKLVVRQKEKAVRELVVERGVLEERMQRRAKEYARKREALEARMKVERKERRRRSSMMTQEISEMRGEIAKMRRTLSNRKERGSVGKKERRESQPHSAREKKIIYLPLPTQIYAPPAQTYAGVQYSQRQPPTPQRPLYTEQQSHTEQISLRQSLRNSEAPQSHRDQLQSQKKTSLFDILSEKLQMAPPSDSIASSRGIPFEMGWNQPPTQPRMVHSLTQNLPSHPYMQPMPTQPLPSVPQLPSKQVPNIMEQLTYAINLKMNGSAHPPTPEPIREESPDLGYLNCLDKSVANSSGDKELLNSHRSKKSNKSLKNSQRSLQKSTNKWKNNDEEDLQMLDLLQNSQRKAPPVAPKPKYSEIGAKITETNHITEQDHFIMSLPEVSREHESFSNSKIHISINSDEKPNHSISNDKGNNSIEKPQQSAPNASKREHAPMAQSSVNIDVNDNNSSRSSDHSSHSQSPSRHTKVNPSLLKDIPRIDEESEDGMSRQNTPIDFHIYNMEPSIDSRYTETPRETTRSPLEHTLTNKMEGSQEMPASPPLSKPPSLSEKEMQQDEDDDMIDSIKLSAESKMSRPTEHLQSQLSKIGLKKQLFLPLESKIREQEEEDDFLGNINLATESRISREKSDKTQQQKEEDVEMDQEHIEAPVLKMTKSDLVQADAVGMENMEAEDSELRRSTTSAVVRKGSAIQKSTKRPNTLSTPNKSSLAISSIMAMSAEIASMAIAQADEEEQEVSSIQRKHNRATSNFR